MDVISFSKSPHVPGDSHKSGERIYAVADGITRIREVKGKWINSYDKLVKISADVFCKKSVSYLAKLKNLITKKDLLNAFEVANKEISKENEKRNLTISRINYLDKDYLSTTGILAVIQKNVLLLSRICDCDAFVLRNKRIVFQTPEYWSTRKKYDGRFGRQLSHPVLNRGFIQRSIRNKPLLGKMAYGTLTGEKESLDFIEFYRYNLNKGDLVFLITDGFRPYFKMKEFLSIFYESKKKKILNKLIKFNSIKEKENKELSKERTLIVVRI